MGLASSLTFVEGLRLSWFTVEVRWLFSGRLAETGPGVEEWFRARPIDGKRGKPAPMVWDPAPPGWRQDRYLLIPGHDDMGIKWREGRLEIKGRERGLGHRVFAPGIEGASERWIKWSYSGAAIERRFLKLFQAGAAGGVVLVEKRRLQRYVRLDRAGAAVEVGHDQSRRRGVTIELVQIRIPGLPGEAHWSLAFKAFSGDADMSEPFAQVVAGFLADCPALPLSAARSMAYPRWLLGFNQLSGTAG